MVTSSKGQVNIYKCEFVAGQEQWAAHTDKNFSEWVGNVNAFRDKAMDGAGTLLNPTQPGHFVPILHPINAGCLFHVSSVDGEGSCGHFEVRAEYSGYSCLVTGISALLLHHHAPL